MLVAGAFGNWSFGNPLGTLLEPQFTLYNYDRRGRNDSSFTPPYAVEREVEDIEALINEAGGSTFVYGISSGAVLALEAAASGLAITGLALYEPPLLVDDSRPRVPDDYLVWLFVMHGPDGTDYDNRVVFVEVVRLERLVYKHGGGEEGDFPQFQVMVTFDEDGPRTRLTMRMVFESPEERARMIEEVGALEGANQTLDRLGEYLAKI